MRDGPGGGGAEYGDEEGGGRKEVREREGKRRRRLNEGRRGCGEGNGDGVKEWDEEGGRRTRNPGLSGEDEDDPVDGVVREWSGPLRV